MAESDIYLVPQDPTSSDKIVPVTDVEIAQNGFKFDAISKYSTQRSYRATRHPLSSGENISDHVIRNPLRFSLTGVFSPYTLQSPIINSITGVGDFFDAPFGLSETTIVSELASFRAQAIETTRRQMRTLIEFGDNHTPLTIVGEEINLPNMVIVRIGDPKATDMGEARMPPVEFQQVRIASQVGEIADIISEEARRAGAGAFLELDR